MKRIIFFISLFYSVWVSAQIGGHYVYDFLSLPASARLTALGDYQIAIMDDDSGLALANPSLLNPEMNKTLSFNNAFYLGGINHGYVSYTHTVLDSLLTLHGGVQYSSYGKLLATTQTGLITGDFSAGDYAFVVGAGHQRGAFSYGLNLKLISSNLENYHSTGMAVDAGVTYIFPEKNLNLSFVLQNMGWQFTTYAGLNDTKQNLPFNMQLGLSHRLRYLPLRITVIAHHLNQWLIRYDDPALRPKSIFEDNSEKTYFVDNLFRHILFNLELNLGKALQIRAGYNHLRKQELQINSQRSLTGFSFGAGLNLKTFDLSYAYSAYHQAGGSHHLSFNLNMGQWVRKKKVDNIIEE